MQPIEHRAREIMGALWNTSTGEMRLSPIEVAGLIARSEQAMVMRLSAFDGAVNLNTSMRQLDAAEQAERDALVAIHTVIDGVAEVYR